jgi:hypothetical protein
MEWSDGGVLLTGEVEVLEEKLVPLPFYLPQIPLFKHKYPPWEVGK